MTKIRDIFLGNKKILNIYITAGYPNLESTVSLIRALNKKADLIEVGVPYSDPLADGTTIQASSEKALKNGMKLHLLFSQLKNIKDEISTPLIMMGYFNQMLQYGPEKYLSDAKDSGVSGMIIPDLPMNIYEAQYKHLFDKYDMEISFLITPFTSQKRIEQADRLSSAFIYMVSQTSITGNTNNISDEQINYFNRINDMNLLSPRLIGFGIHDKATFSLACQYSNGGIIGSAFIRAINNDENIEQKVNEFIDSIR